MKKFLKPPSGLAGPPGDAAGEPFALAAGEVPDVAALEVVVPLAGDIPAAGVIPIAGEVPGAGAPGAGERPAEIGGCTPVAVLGGTPTGIAGDVAGAIAGAAGAPGRAIGVLPGPGGGGGCWPNEVSAKVKERRLAVSSVFIG